MVCIILKDKYASHVDSYYLTGSRGPAVLDDFTSSYGYKFNDPAGYQWPVHNTNQNKL